MTAAPMKITALAPWFGSKRNLAPAIVTELGPHRAYWEPFCGSMAVLLAKEPATMETVNDLHGDLINLARIVRDPVKGPMLYRRLRRVMMAKAMHTDAADVIRYDITQPDDVSRAEAYFIASWMGRNGVAGSRSYNFGYCTRYTKNGGHAATRFANAVESIPAWRRRLRRVNILNQDAFTLIERVEDADGVVMYIDSPYIVKGAKYVHDFEAEDHQRLAHALSRFRRTRVVVSYYEHPRLVEMYAGWTKRTFDVSKAMASQGKRDKENDIRALEVLLINGPSLVEPDQLIPGHASGLFNTPSPIHPVTPSGGGHFQHQGTTAQRARSRRKAVGV